MPIPIVIIRSSEGSQYIDRIFHYTETDTGEQLDDIVSQHSFSTTNFIAAAGNFLPLMIAWRWYQAYFETDGQQNEGPGRNPGQFQN